ncbi:hypothetical protein ACFWG0_26380 [Streptomyces yangpuensis]|uniref:hypothetical protein n=1 Tax=Streptomyces yangpuensis TaxID=1648182 RepID=UPI00364864E1
MGVRFGVIGESAAEVEGGLELLRGLGVPLVVTMPASRMTDGRWMARVTPQAPADGEGLGER